MIKYNRILLKLSGESLAGATRQGIDTLRLKEYATQIKQIADIGVQIGIVIGGGNIFRGLSGATKGFDRVQGDQMGMLATVINSLALNSALQANGTKSRVLTSVRMEPVGEYYSKRYAVECLERGEVVIIAGGTSNPYITTDTATPFTVNFDGADAGKTVYYWLRWVNTRSERGPWSSQVSAMVVG